jgi:hypothetical protein
MVAMPMCDQQQRVAVGVGLGHLVGADRAASAGGVFDDDVAPPSGLRSASARSRATLVGGATRGKGHDDRDGLVLAGKSAASTPVARRRRPQGDDQLEQIIS